MSHDALSAEEVEEFRAEVQVSLERLRGMVLGGGHAKSTDAAIRDEENNLRLFATLDQTRALLEAQSEALAKINDIRNSIVAFQTVNWSEHIYPLVAALNKAGFKGMPFAEAWENFGTLLERANKAESQLAAVAKERDELREAINWWVTEYADEESQLEAAASNYPQAALLYAIVKTANDAEEQETHEPNTD